MYCHHGVCFRAKFTLPGYYVECLLDGVVQDIFADSSGTPIVSVSGVANRAQADSRGNFNFYVDGGTYDLRYYDQNGVYQFTESGYSMLDLPPSSVSTSAGAADTGKGVLLNANGALDRTILAPDGYQKAKRIVLSDTGSVGNLGNWTGTALDGLLQITGTDQLSVGLQSIIFGNHTKGVQDYIGKSRGAAIGDMAVLVAGDRIYTQNIQAADAAGVFGHVGTTRWFLDGTPDANSEMHGAWEISTGTGNNITEDAVYYGLRVAIRANSKQQVYFPGKLTAIADIPAAAANHGAIVRIGKGGANAGEAAMLFDLTGAALMTTPVAGAYEVDSAGVHYITNSSAKRDAVLVGQVKASGDSGAIAAGAAAGTGPTISVVWGNGCATVTLTTGTSPATGDLFTLTFPHTFPTRSYVFLQGGNDNAATYVGRNLGVTTSTSNVLVRAPATAPAASTQYIIHVFYQGN